MKKLLIIGLSLFSLSAMAQTDMVAGKEVGGNPVAFKTMVIERTDIPYDSKESFTFEFTNTGSEPVLITNVITSCGCTKAQQPTAPVMAGESEKVVVNYDTKRVGPFTKTITVTTNVSADPIVLTIKGNVMPAPAVDAPAAPAAPATGHEGHNHN